MKTLVSLLQAPSTRRLSQLMSHVQSLSMLNQFLQASLTSPLREHCAVANWRQDGLVIRVDSAVWASQLRYHLPELQKHLRAIPGLQSLKSIRYYVMSCRVD